MSYPAEKTAFRPNKGKRLKSGQPTAFYPTHGDRNSSMTITQDGSKLSLAGPKRPSGLMQQLVFSDFKEWLPESVAAEYLGLDTPTLRDLRAGHRKGIIPFRECSGEYYYNRADLDDWLANNAQRKAAREGRKNQTSRGILA